MNITIWEFVGIIITMISFIMNFYQWNRSRDVEKKYYSNLFAIYNHMHRIAELAGLSRTKYEKNKISSNDEIATYLIRNIEQSTGIADSVRTEVLAFSERYLKKPIWHRKPYSQTCDESFENIKKPKI
jgi:hypothetical protein